MKKGLPNEYKQRTKIETVHYVIKRKFLIYIFIK